MEKLYLAYSYVQEWLFDQLRQNDLILPKTGFELADSLFSARRTRLETVINGSSSILAPRQQAVRVPFDGLMVEYRDPDVNQILSLWMASFSEDPPADPFEGSGFRPVLVRLPDWVVLTEARAIGQGRGYADNFIREWNGSLITAGMHLERWETGSRTVFSLDDFRLAISAPPMRINFALNRDSREEYV